MLSPIRRKVGNIITATAFTNNISKFDTLKVKEILKIDVGQTTEDGLFSIEATRCVGACGLAPVFTVNDEVYGKATPEMVESVISKIRSEEA